MSGPIRPTSTSTSPAASELRPARVGGVRSSTWRLFRGLRIHLAALLASLFCVFYLITAALIYGLTAQLTQADVDAILRDTTRPLAAQVATSLNHGLFPKQFVTLAKLSQMYPKVSAIVLRDSQGNNIASTQPAVTSTLPYQIASNTLLVTTDELPTQSWYRVLTVRLTNPNKLTTGYLQVAINVDRDRIALARLRKVLLLVGGTGIALAAAAGFILSKLSLRPAVRAWQLQEQFVADASHELRTPLTVMRLNLELVTSQPDATVAENTQWLQSIEEEIHRLHRLTDQLLTLAGSDAAAAAMVQCPVDLAELVYKAADAFRLPANAKGLELYVESEAHGLAGGSGFVGASGTVEVAGAGGTTGSVGSAQTGGTARSVGGARSQEAAGMFTVLGDPDELYRLLTILVDNAIKYTAAGRIDLRLERRRHQVWISVRDTGIGIDPPHLQRVFDRFYRTDAARTKGTGGTGLGLSIARAIAAAHHGRITVDSVPGECTTFVVSLPVAARTR